MSDRSALSGWALVGWTALGVGLLSLYLLGRFGTGEEGLRVLLRATARVSLVLFLAAYSASSLLRLAGSPTTRWLRRNRRYLGVAFAVSHAVHALAIAGLLRVTGEAPEPLTAVVGGGALLVLAAMTATSFDRSAAWLGARRWRHLHRGGIHYLWFVFAFTYAAQAVRDPVSAVATLLLFAALGLRGAAWRRRRAPSRARGPGGQASARDRVQ